MPSSMVSKLFGFATAEWLFVATVKAFVLDFDQEKIRILHTESAQMPLSTLKKELSSNIDFMPPRESLAKLTFRFGSQAFGGWPNQK